MAFRIYVILSLPKKHMRRQPMNQILTFQLDSISLNAGVPENSGISRNVPISEDFEAHGVLQFSLSNLPAQAKANPY